MEETNMDNIQQAVAALDKFQDSPNANEGYRRVKPIDKDQYPKRQGLVGPFGTSSGKVLYYDPKEGSYYDSDSDLYVSVKEYEKYNNSTKATYHNSPLTDPTSREYKYMAKKRGKLGMRRECLNEADGDAAMRYRERQEGSEPEYTGPRRLSNLPRVQNVSTRSGKDSKRPLVGPGSMFPNAKPEKPSEGILRLLDKIAQKKARKEETGQNGGG